MSGGSGADKSIKNRRKNENRLWRTIFVPREKKKRNYEREREKLSGVSMIFFTPWVSNIYIKWWWEGGAKDITVKWTAAAAELLSTLSGNVPVIYRIYIIYIYIYL